MISLATFVHDILGRVDAWFINQLTLFYKLGAIHKLRTQMGEGGFAKCLRFSKWGETFYANREETGGVCQLPTFVYYVEGEGFKYRLCTAPFAFTHQLTKS